MKVVNQTFKDYPDSFSGSHAENWAAHVDKLETEVFEAEGFGAKQCYYSIRKTLAAKALSTLQDMERGLETPDWGACIPHWFQPDNEDLSKVVRHQLFTSFSYSFRCALLVVYFHKKFQRGSAKRAWRVFQDAAQRTDESLEQWSSRIDSYVIDLKRYGTIVQFEDYLEQWCTGTRPGHFLNKLREAKNPITPGKVPVVHDLKSFITFRTAMFSNALQTKRENEKHRELIARKGRALHDKLKANTPKRKPVLEGGKNRFDKNKVKSNLPDPKDGPRQVRNPHSKLMDEKPPPTRRALKEGRDMSRIKCYNCNKFGHFASKCPIARRPRQQRSDRVRAMAAQALPEYTAQEMLTPEAVRDNLHVALSGFAASVMDVLDPILDTINRSESHTTENHESEGAVDLATQQHESTEESMEAEQDDGESVYILRHGYRSIQSRSHGIRVSRGRSGRKRY